MKIKLPQKFKKKITNITNTTSLFEEENNDVDISILSIESIVDILKEKKNYLLSQDVERYVRFVSFDKGVLFINFDTGYPRELLKNLNAFFANAKYKIKVEHSNEVGEDTIYKKKRDIFEAQLKEMLSHPILKEILQSFKNSYVAKIEEI